MKKHTLILTIYDGGDHVSDYHAVEFVDSMIAALRGQYDGGDEKLLYTADNILVFYAVQMRIAQSVIEYDDIIVHVDGTIMELNEYGACSNSSMDEYGRVILEMHKAARKRIQCNTAS